MNGGFECKLHSPNINNWLLKVEQSTNLLGAKKIGKDASPPVPKFYAYVLGVA